MLRIAVCDDNAQFLAEFKARIEAWDERPQDMLLLCFENGDALIEVHQKAPFDIILLDIVMPLINGLEVAREIRVNDKEVKIVFLTSSPEFAVESYSVRADNYLLKPVNTDRLLSCLREEIAEVRMRERCLVVKGASSVHRLFLHNIEYVEAQNKGVLFALADGQKLKSSEPMYVYEDQLFMGDDFVKCHRSYVVNIFHVSTYGAGEIRMRSGCRIPISRGCQKDFEAAYFSMIFGTAGEDE